MQRVTRTTGGIEAAFEAHRRYLWSVIYRMVGTAADADDLVQDTFERAVRTPPPDTERDLRPWLVRVAVNASIDHLRKRKETPYDGTWLPSPVETPVDDPFWREPEGPSARYDRLESVSFAFLCALEALTPTQRAVLLLRDALGYSVLETAEALALSEPNVKTTHHRARAALESYDAARVPPTRDGLERALAVLRTFLHGLGADDGATLRALLRDDAVMINDGGGRYFAARKPVYGVERILLFIRKTRGEGVPRVRPTVLNGVPAILFERRPYGPRIAPRLAMLLDVDAAGRIRAVHFVIAPDKLSPALFDGLRYPGLLDVAAIVARRVRRAFAWRPVRADR